MEEEKVRSPDDIRRDVLIPSRPSRPSRRQQWPYESINSINSINYINSINSIGERRGEGGEEMEDEMRLAMEMSCREYEERIEKEHRVRIYRLRFRLVCQRLGQFGQQDPTSRCIHRILENLQNGDFSTPLWTTEVSAEKVKKWIQEHIKSSTYACLGSLLDSPEFSFLWQEINQQQHNDP